MWKVAVFHSNARAPLPIVVDLPFRTNAGYQKKLHALIGAELSSGTLLDPWHNGRCCGESY